MSWSKHGHECCQACGTTEKKHHGGGLCVTCHSAKRFANPATRAQKRAKQRAYYEQNRAKYIENRREQRALVVGTCVVCGKEGIKSRGLCQRCYDRNRKAGTLDNPTDGKSRGYRWVGWRPQLGDWAIEKEPDNHGRKLIGQVVKSPKRMLVHEVDGEKVVTLELAVTGKTVPLKLDSLERYTGLVPERMWGEFPEFDMGEVLGLLEVA